MTLREKYEQLQRECLFAFVAHYFNVLNPGRAYRRARHVEAMCVALERVARGRCKRLIITVPPRHLKSTAVAVTFPAWILGSDPSKKILVSSYGADLAQAHARSFRTVIQQPSFRQLFPHFRVDSVRDTASETVTTMHGGRKAVSLGGPVTGFGADIIIIDDQMKATDAHSPIMRAQVQTYFDETLFSRLNDKQEGAIIVIQQRLHEDDLVGHLLDRGGWEHINLPAFADQPQSLPLYWNRTFERKIGDVLAPELEDRATLEVIRAQMGPAAFSAQYLQNPMPIDGNRIAWQWFCTYEEPLSRGEYSYIAQSWDTATSADPNADFSVCLTLGYDQGKWDLLDIVRKRLDYPDLLREAKRLYRTWQPDRVIVEDAGTGRALMQSMREELPGIRRRAIIPHRPLANKETRLDIQSAKIESGLVVLPECSPWLADFKRELLGFPNARHDDQVDALTQFLEWTASPMGRSIGMRDPLTGRLRSRPRPRGGDYSQLNY
jgi:predicted phage terminase large subunit-like protein